MVGRRLGRFQILSLLGQGGMASVWRARDGLTGRHVALKILNEALASSADACRRFRREADIAALLDHPSIAPVLECREDEGVVYLVMAWIDGRTLADCLSDGLPSIPDALRTVAITADALGYAHGRGVLHRDVSSRNIMVGRDGRVFVLDFGLARALDRSRMSSSGARLGTLAYMAPEVMRGDEADPRSDLYGLGVTLYHYLTGNFPFSGERDEVVVYQRLNVPPTPARALRPEISEPLDALLMRAMARDPAERWQSADEMSAALRALAEPAAAHAGNGDGPWQQAVTDAAAPRELGARIAAGTARVFLGIPPFSAAGESAVELAGTLRESLCASLAVPDRVHVTPLPALEDPAIARAAGVNLILRAGVRSTGTAVRVAFSLEEPGSGVAIGGGGVDGSATLPFELEDRLIASVRRALGPAAEGARRSRSADPARDEKYALALTYMQRFDNEASLDGAIGLLEGLIASEGDSAKLHATLARAFVLKYRLTRQRAWEARAEGAIDRARSVDGEAPDVLLASGELHEAAGRHAEALADIDRAMIGGPDSYDGFLARASALDGLGRVPEAEECCQRMIAMRRDDWRAYHALGMLLYRHGRYAQATGPWQRITELTPDNASAHRNLGSAYFNLGRLDEAVASFQRSNDIRPNAMALYNLGTALMRLERYEECVAAFEKAVALNPSDPLAWGNLGSAYRYIPGHEPAMRAALQRAVGIMRERLDREPAGGESWALLASWHANLGQSSQADEALLRAIADSSMTTACMEWIAETCHDLGRRNDALGWMRQAREHGCPGSRFRRRAFQSLAGDPEYERILVEDSPLHGSERGT